MYYSPLPLLLSHPNPRYQSRLDEARAYFEKAVEHDPREADALLGLARLETMNDRHPEAFERAEALYRRSLDLHPRNGGWV